jgi:hypothetical protein
VRDLRYGDVALAARHAVAAQQQALTVLAAAIGRTVLDRVTAIEPKVATEE